MTWLPLLLLKLSCRGQATLSLFTISSQPMPSTLKPSGIRLQLPATAAAALVPPPPLLLLVKSGNHPHQQQKKLLLARLTLLQQQQQETCT
jgi:hypothetical protein